ncbi:hypothetical protein F5884DRAFT_389398 [Xylogone sp. PMI_703]|nr:hypothetical protein F5884DRAFT_389398 [Xylogone sp. PMI_703]
MNLKGVITNILAEPQAQQQLLPPHLQANLPSYRYKWCLLRWISIFPLHRARRQFLRSLVHCPVQLLLPHQLLLSSTPTAIAEAHKSNTAAIVGGVVGGVAGLTAIAGAALFCFRRRRKANYKAYNPPKMISPDGSPRSTIRHDFSPPRQIVQGDVPHLPAEPPATASNTLGSPPPYASERPAGEMDPFVSEINDFSRSWTAVFSNQGARQSSSSWHDAIFGEGSRPGTEAGEVEGGLSIQAGYVPAHMRRNSSVYSSRSTRFNFGGAQNTRTVDLDVSRESIRSGESESVVISPASFSTPAAALYSVSLDDDNEDFLERTLSTRGRVVSANVRNEGWSPSGLNIPPKPGQAAAPDGRKRYSLSDTSSEGRALPVLSSRGSRPQKDRASMGSSRGGFGYGSVSVVSE